MLDAGRIGRTVRLPNGEASSGGDGRPGNPETLLVAVDEQDRETGVVELMTAHRQGILHRAFSIFVFDDADRLLLQRRATGKYHSGGLWSNTCCSHPRVGESLLAGAHRRLREEMGFDCPLRVVFGFVYRAELDHGLAEHEYDHVVVGRFPGTPVPNADEVADWKWEDLPAIRSQLTDTPRAFTAWFGMALDGLLARGFPQ